jgi:ATP-dependent protease ClpP protease subunit
MFKVDGSEIYLYDIIGPSWAGYIGSEDVIAALAENKSKRMTIRINSPGGSVDEGIAIYNALSRHAAGVNVVVDSVAASIASVIALAGETVVMASNAKLMIHDPWTFEMGNASKLRKTADVLDLYTNGLVDIYKKKTGLGESEIRDMMNAETWLSATDALAKKFIDGIDGESQLSPQVPKGMHNNVPSDVGQATISAGTRTRDMAKIVNRLKELKVRSI